MANLEYRVVLEPEADGSAFNVHIPAFPHAFTFGTTVDEALANAREIIALEIADRQASGEEIPLPDAATAIVTTVSVPAA